MCSSSEKRENLSVVLNCFIRRSPMAADAVLQVQPLSSVFHVYRISGNCECIVTTFGIVGIFYVEPYYQGTMAELYSVNRTLAYQNGYIR